jgi:hypothetical protein
LSLLKIPAEDVWMLNLIYSYPSLCARVGRKEGNQVLNNMSETYIEGIVTLSPGANADQVRSWFEQHGFAATRMAGGLLVAGAPSLFEKSLGITQGELAARSTRDVLLSIPDDLREFVTSIGIRRLPSIHK